jgi:hypothetical protein
MMGMMERGAFKSLLLLPNLLEVGAGRRALNLGKYTVVGYLTMNPSRYLYLEFGSYISSNSLDMPVAFFTIVAARESEEYVFVVIEQVHSSI